MIFENSFTDEWAKWFNTRKTLFTHCKGTQDPLELGSARREDFLVKVFFK